MSEYGPARLDSAGHVPRSLVVDPSFDWADRLRPHYSYAGNSLNAGDPITSTRCRRSSISCPQDPVVSRAKLIAEPWDVSQKLFT